MNTTSLTTRGESDGSRAYIDFNKDNGSELQTATDTQDAVLPSTTDAFFIRSVTTTMDNHNHTNTGTPNVILYNFIFMSLLFSSNHGCVVACLSLATARLGSLGAYQNGLLYVFGVRLLLCGP